MVPLMGKWKEKHVLSTLLTRMGKEKNGPHLCPLLLRYMPRRQRKSRGSGTGQLGKI